MVNAFIYIAKNIFAEIFCTLVNFRLQFCNQIEDRFVETIFDSVSMLYSNLKWYYLLLNLLKI